MIESISDKNTLSLFSETCSISGSLPFPSVTSFSMAVIALTMSLCPVPCLDSQRQNIHFLKKPSILGSTQMRCCAFSTSVITLFVNNWRSFVVNNSCWFKYGKIAETSNFSVIMGEHRLKVIFSLSNFESLVGDFKYELHAKAIVTCNYNIHIQNNKNIASY